MGERGVPTEALARHLHAAIERLRDDMEKVEFWADAVSGFAEPVPDYRPEEVTVWLPSEQAAAVSSVQHEDSSEQSPRSKKR